MIAVLPPQKMLLRFGKLALAGLAPLLIVGTVGAYITHQVAGGPGLKAMLAGCAVGLAGNWAGAVPVIMVDDLAGRSGGPAVLLGTAVRFLAALVITPVLALSGWVEVNPFVLWVALSYMTILFGETIATVLMARAGRGPHQ